MGIRDLFKSKQHEANESAATSIEPLLNLLAHGNDGQMDTLVYRSERLSQAARQACANVLSYHFCSPSSEHCLTEKSRHQSGKFMLLVLTPTWKDDGEQNTIPLIITVEQNRPRVVGIMSPFDDLMGLLSNKKCSEIGALTGVWITRKQRRHSPSV